MLSCWCMATLIPQLQSRKVGRQAGSMAPGCEGVGISCTCVCLEPERKRVPGVPYCTPAQEAGAQAQHQHTSSNRQPLVTFYASMLRCTPSRLLIAAGSLRWSNRLFIAQLTVPCRCAVHMKVNQVHGTALQQEVGQHCHNDQADAAHNCDLQPKKSTRSTRSKRVSVS